MKTTVSLWTRGAVLLAVTMIATAAMADPPNTYILKFVQKPLVELKLDPAGTSAMTFYGHDEFSTAYLEPTGPDQIFRGTFMADDFADKIDRPVAHVQWWGSYMNEMPTPERVQRFLICFEKDVPATLEDFSHPGEVLLSQIVALSPAGSTIPAPGEFTERPIHPGGPPANETLYQYNAELSIPFDQEADEVYWLKIVALVNPNENPNNPIRWGWHNRDYTVQDPLASTPPAVVPGEHVQGVIPLPSGEQVPVWHFQDDAVTGDIGLYVMNPGTPDMKHRVEQPVTTMHETYYLPNYDVPEYVTERFSKDLAFALYAVPEPSTVLLLLAGLGCLFAARMTSR